MGLETAAHISELVPTNPVGASDTKSQGDDHLRMLKAVLQADFPNADKPFYFPRAATKTANYTVLATDENKFLVGNANAGAITFTLPTLTAAQDGWQVTIIKSDVSANLVTVAGTINTVVNYILERQYQAARFTWSGTAWFASVPEHPIPFRVITKTATATLTLREMGSIVLVTPAAATTITFPAATAGAWVYVKNLSAAFDVTINPPGAVTVDGALTFLLDDQYEAALFVSDGTNWFVAAHFQGTFPVIPAHPASSVVNLVLGPNAVGPGSFVDLSADEAVLVDTNGISIKHRAIAVSFGINVIGAGGVDVSAATANAEYYLWLISNGTLVDVVGHKTNMNAPTMPAGYTFKKFVGWAKTNASGSLYRIVQKGDIGAYIQGAGLPVSSVIIQDGAIGSTNAVTPNLGPVSWAGLAPLNAKSLLLAVTNRYTGAGPHDVIIAPNNDWEGTNRGPFGNAGMVYPAWLRLDDTGTNMMGEIVPESTSIYYAGSGAGAAVAMMGWRLPI